MSLSGEFIPPGDKSVSHRLALFTLLGRGRMEVRGFSPCQDCDSSLAAVRLLGVSAEFHQRGMTLTGTAGRFTSQADLDCGNSGTTMRLMMGILAGREGRWSLDGDQSLRRRPMERVAGPLREMGARVTTTEGRPPVKVEGGGLTGRDHTLKVASAQLKSALLLAGLQAQGATVVREPAPSRDHTERLFRLMGAHLTGGEGVWTVEPGLLTLPALITVPGDPSAAAFFLCAAALLPGSRVTSRRVLLNPTRLGWLTVLERMGAVVEVNELGGEPEPWGEVTVTHGPELTACRVAPHEIPLLVDEVPILALVATQARGETVFEAVDELRHKESDRLAAIIGQLGAMGADLEARGDDLVVHGPTPLALPAGELDSFSDHRMAMTLALAGRLAGGEARVKDAASAGVSYPGFYHALGMLSR
ncbi:MAG: 3-phosphoshikimate 1-carboxyvinyltransferase [Deltaproteobacteria bacterium]|nr:3-phosphoshikimate 1-carboxyvinyltransferase [Deltaproteobacteria bacterium]